MLLILPRVRIKELILKEEIILTIPLRKIIQMLRIISPKEIILVHIMFII